MNLESMLQSEEQAGNSIAALVLKMQTVKAELDAAEAHRKAMQERYDNYRKVLIPDALAAASLSSARVDGIGLVYLTKKVHASVPKAKQEEFFDWLSNNGHDGLATYSIHPQTLTAWVKEQQEAGNPIPEYVSVFEDPQVAIRK